MTYPFTIKDIYKNPNDFIVNFERYRKGYLYYSITAYISDTVYVYEFRVPVGDCGDAEFKKRDKATLFRRYIEASIKDESFKYVTEWKNTVGISIANPEGITRLNFID